MICKKCNFQNEETAKFCRNCGEKLNNQQPLSTNKICPKCNIENEGDAQFCKKCAASFDYNKLRRRKKNFFLILLLINLVGWGFLFRYNFLQKEDFVEEVKEIDYTTYDDGVVINGVRWATRNVDKPGTFVTNPADAGMFYQWNRKIGWSTADPMISSNGDQTWDKTCPTGSIWATANNVCPPGWRIPTVEEQQELLISDSQWTTKNDKIGWIIGYANNAIFLPATGYRDDIDGELYWDNGGLYWKSGAYGQGFYWSSTTDAFGDPYMMYLWGDTAFSSSGSDTRELGFCIRCVAE